MKKKHAILFSEFLLLCAALILALPLYSSTTKDVVIAPNNDTQQRSGTVDTARTGDYEYFGLGIHLFDEYARKEIASNTNRFLDRICSAYEAGSLGFYIIHVTFDEILQDVQFDGDQPIIRINDRVARDIHTLASRCSIPIGLRLFSPVRGEGKLAKFQAYAMRDLFPYTARGRNLWFAASDKLLSSIADLSQLKMIFWSWEDFWRTTSDWDFAISPNVCLWAHRNNIFTPDIPDNCQRPFSLSSLEKKRFWQAFDKEVVSAVNQLAPLKDKYPDILFGWQPRIDWDDRLDHDRHFDVSGFDFTVLSAATYMADRGNNSVDDQVQRCSKGEQQHCRITNEKQAVNNILIRLMSYQDRIKTPYILFDQLLSKNWDMVRGFAYIEPSKRNSFYETLITKLLGVFHNQETSVLGIATWGSLERIHNFLLDATFNDSISGPVNTLGHWETRLLTTGETSVALENKGITLTNACIRQEVPGSHLRKVRSFARVHYSGDKPELEVSCRVPYRTIYFKKSLASESLVPVYDDFETTGCSVFLVELCSKKKTSLKQVAWGPIDSDGFLDKTWLKHLESISIKTERTMHGDDLFNVVPQGLATDVTPSDTTNYWLEKTSRITHCSINPQNDKEIRISLFYPEILSKNIGTQNVSIVQTDSTTIRKPIKVGKNYIHIPIKATGPCISLNLIFDRACTPGTCNGDARPIACLLKQIDISPLLNTNK